MHINTTLYFETSGTARQIPGTVLLDRCSAFFQRPSSNVAIFWTPCSLVNVYQRLEVPSACFEIVATEDCKQVPPNGGTYVP